MEQVPDQPSTEYLFMITSCGVVVCSGWYKWCWYVWYLKKGDIKKPHLQDAYLITLTHAYMCPPPPPPTHTHIHALPPTHTQSVKIREQQNGKYSKRQHSNKNSNMIENMTHQCDWRNLFWPDTLWRWCTQQYREMSHSALTDHIIFVKTETSTSLSTYLQKPACYMLYLTK